jgi:hypothetical protein
MSIRIDGTNTTANPGITGSDTDTGLQFGTNEVKVVTDGTAQATLDNSGNLLFTQEAASSPYPQQQIKWSNDSTTENGFYISQDTSRNGRVWHEQGLEILFGTNNTERMRILAAGGLTFNGDTAAANALDDYEEGTFTGRFNNSDDDATVSHGNQTGFYVKVGDLVHFSLYFDDIDISASGSTTNARIFGLPFTSLGTAQHYSVVNIIHNTTITSSAGGYVNTNSTVVIPTNEGTTTTSTFSTGTNFRLMIGGTYRAA